MKIGVLCALQKEADELLNHFSGADELHVDGLTVFEARYRGHIVFVTVGGLGKVYAASAAQSLISRFTPAVMINIGLAGSCDTALSIGETVVADKTLMHDFDYTLSESFAGCPAPSEPDEKLVKLALAVCKELSLPATRGTLATGDVFVNDSELKRDIVRRTGCRCVDMEGGAFAAVCERNGVRCCVIKIMSDSADENANDDISLSMNRYCYLSENIVLGLVAMLD